MNILNILTIKGNSTSLSMTYDDLREKALFIFVTTLILKLN